MATSKLNDVIQHLRRILLLRDDGGLTDGQLMDEYIRLGEEAALAALVRRHGPMVWGVCCRTLGNSHDAEDAFQSTFLVFVRKAASVTPKEMIGNWLYGVAHQTALNARAAAIRRRKREKPVADMPEPARDDPGHDLLPYLDQELSGLPDKYRAVIVLCDLEGKTRKEAAQHLGVPEGTVAGQLARARTMLAKRLSRHGPELSSAVLGAVLAQYAASAGVPGLIVSSTIQAVTSVAAGQAAAGVISTKVLALTEGVLKTMLLKQLKVVTAVLLVLGTVATYGGGRLITQYSEAAQEGEKPKKQIVEKKAPTETKKAASKELKKKPFTNSIGMKFVWIPPGSFMMGSPKTEKERLDNETQHNVTLTKGFYMGVYTVTQEEWRAVMRNNPSGFKGDNNLPVETVSWDDCQDFIKKLREKDKKPYRLPTEAEWEYACRAGTTTPFHFGETISTEQANYDGRSGKGGYRGKTTPVGSFPANAWGLHDMHGNVWQWCQDWSADYPDQNVVDPQGPDTVERQQRVLRGGTWDFSSQFCRSACRYRIGPGNHYSYFGFRLCFTEGVEQKGPVEPKKEASDMTKEKVQNGVQKPEQKPTTISLGVSPVQPAPAESVRDRMLETAFGKDCKELKRLSRIWIPSQRLVIALDKFTADGDGKLKLAPCSMAVFSEKEGDGSASVLTTIQTDWILLTLDRPATQLDDLANRKIVAIEMSGFPKVSSERP